MDFGTFLKNVLTKRNINISHLAEQTHIKSKNTFYRLFQNYYSFEKSKEITDKILEVVDITAEEKAQIYNLMQMCRMNKNVLKSCMLMQNLYTDRCEIKADISRNGNAIWLREDCEDLILFMGLSTTEQPALISREILTHTHAKTKSLMHYIDFSKSDEYIASALFSMIMLAGFADYDCAEVTQSLFPDLLGFLKLKNGYGYFMVSSNGEYAETELSEEFFRFILKQYSKIKHKPLKTRNCNVTDYAGIMSDFSYMEDNDLFTFEGMFCFADLPFEIMYKLLEDANFLGLPPDSEYIKNLVTATQCRFEVRYNSTSKKAYIFDEDKLRSFLETGRTLDHPSFFRALTPSERKVMIEKFKNNPNRFKFRFFKNDFHCNFIECGVVKNHSIFMWNADSGYEHNHFHITLTNPKAVKFYESFCHYFWQFCAMSQEESDKLFNDIVNEYIN